MMKRNKYRPLRRNTRVKRSELRGGYYDRRTTGRTGGHRGIRAALAVLLLAGLGVAAYVFYIVYAAPATHAGEPMFVYIRPGTEVSEVEQQISKRAGLAHPTVFRGYCALRGLSRGLRLGRYCLQPGMSMRAVVNELLRAEQSPVEMYLREPRTTAELTGFFGNRLEMKSSTLDSLLTDSAYCRRLGGFTIENVRVLFMPGRYCLKWDITPEALLDTFQRRYRAFWTSDRRAKADSLGLDPVRAAVLASIVQSESKMKDEYADIAALYLNRLQRNIPLQADPTAVYASGDFQARRITGTHLRVESPYNTYLYNGLPPGPICLPFAATIDSVLAMRPHPYVYMCAKDDFSGHHAFAATFSQHLENARRYRAALDKRNIK